MESRLVTAVCAGYIFRQLYFRLLYNIRIYRVLNMYCVVVPAQADGGTA